jgi:hypothetical protein
MHFQGNNIWKDNINMFLLGKIIKIIIILLLNLIFKEHGKPERDCMPQVVESQLGFI